MTNHVWSPQQENVRTEFKEGTDNFVVRALAGTGKTTIIMEGVSLAPERNILVCAFSKIIERELTARVERMRLKGKVTAKTLHGVGYAAVSRYWPLGNGAGRLKVDFGTTRQNALAEKICGAVAPDAIKKLVATLCTKGREIAPHAKVVGDLTDIAIRFECDPDDEWAADGFDLRYVEEKALAAMELAATVKPVDTGIDGADMIFLPLRNRWLRKTYDMVVVDEAQDMTTAQLEMAIGVCSGRIVVVGDNHQAIFGFRGADSESLDRLKTELHAKELPLSTTYRCGRAIVDVAREWVPAYEAGAMNPDGEVTTLALGKLVETAGAGDFVLSRVNAPLVSIAMSLLRNGKRARVAGRDIGKGLLALLRKMNARTVPELLSKISKWEEKEIKRLIARYNGAEAGIARQELVHDQAEMLTSICEGAKSANDVTNRITALFTLTEDEEKLGVGAWITCSSVHRAKGLEADRVFILQNTLRQTSQEEVNICYVAVTRAKKSLVWVTE